MSEFEEVIEQIGAFGPYQIRVFILVSMFETPAAWAMLLPIFAGAKPTWICGATVANATGNVTNSTDGYNYTDNSCSVDGKICEGAQYTSDYVSIVSEWGLVCDLDYLSDLITTIQMIGVLLGACIAGQLADTFGRRRVFYIVYFLLLITGFASAFATSWQMYAALRFFIGAFFGGTMVINFVLPLEFIGPKWRTFCGCIGFWACGVMTLALIAYILRDWRHLTIATSTGGVFLLLTWWYVPESPRWLLQKGRQKEAEAILTKMAIFNRKPVPDFSQLRVYIAKQQKSIEENRKYSYWDLFRNTMMAKNTLILVYAWFVSSSVYYGTSLNLKNLSGDRYINVFLSGLVELPVVILVVLLNNRVGRKKTLAGLMFVAGLSMFAILFVDVAGKLKEWPALTTTLAMLGRSGIAGGWAAAQVFSAEVFPTVVRNIGVGACSMAARVGGITAPQIVFLNKFAQPLPFVVFGGLALLCSFLAWCLPETRARPLPDTLPPWQGKLKVKLFADDGEIKLNGNAGCAKEETEHLEKESKESDDLVDDAGGPVASLQNTTVSATAL